ncbi:MAG: hypothetical protein BLM47_13965 [Candidatus Reconcilbacillus cellulovorans]|uniref:Transposase IS4-like domain-containing protein n=1 Tax=Candidatus Reconcilbacillus cellulovorans TaxID=1906605 RepID=A0A2A6DVU9_9BACL|nr:MAG: hypothetical protein BLM47_13965 [Candidatus Reconcilbacillus cellulovorans]
MKHECLLEDLFDKLVKQLSEALPEFGKYLAIDSKAISSFAKRKNPRGQADGRRDTDADYGCKTYRGQREGGTWWEKVVRWFGYKLHLIVDATYELPVAYSVTKASQPDINEAHALLERMKRRQPDLLETAETLAGDKGYDDTKLIVKCWDEYKIKPVIDIRNCWKDGEETRVLTGKANVVYDYEGHVYWFLSGNRNTARDVGRRI